MSDVPGSVTPAAPVAVAATETASSACAPTIGSPGDASPPTAMDAQGEAPASAGAERGTIAIAKLYRDLNEKCGAILAESFAGDLCQLHADSHAFLHELESWSAALAPNREAQLLVVAAREYQYALLALSQGHYRHAFKGLRLVLELCLQTIHLATHRLELQEWMESRKDTVWGALMDEENGVLSVRFARAFFADLEPDVRHHRSLAAQLYRECSECVHANIQKHIPLPDALEFRPDTLRLWHHKAKGVALAAVFALVLRYLKEIPPERAQMLEQDLMDRLGHIEALRRHFGGPEGG